MGKVPSATRDPFGPLTSAKMTKKTYWIILAVYGHEFPIVYPHDIQPWD